jgi:hypothetical protein
MAKKEEYELLPHEEIERLRKEVEKLKKSPYGDTETGRNLLDSMEELNESLKKLISIFEKTNAEIMEEYENSKPAERLSRIEEQNQKIAGGIVALSNMIKEHYSNKPSGMQNQFNSSISGVRDLNLNKPPVLKKDNDFQNRSMGQMPGNRQMPPPPVKKDGLFGLSENKTPREEDKRGGLFNRLKK